jgi:hypothetical protein
MGLDASVKIVYGMIIQVEGDELCWEDFECHLYDTLDTQVMDFDKMDDGEFLVFVRASKQKLFELRDANYGSAYSVATNLIVTPKPKWDEMLMTVGDEKRDWYISTYVG